MSKKAKITKIFISPDFILALVGGILFTILMVSPASAITVKDISSLSVTMLSIIFSFFFTALAVLITSGDNDFLKFLQKFNGYTEIIWSYKFTFLSIFIALLFSIVLYITTLFEIAKQIPGVYPWFILSPYIFSSLYALFSTVLATFDAIKYAEYRTEFLILTSKIIEQNEKCQHHKNNEFNR